MKIKLALMVSAILSLFILSSVGQPPTEKAKPNPNATRIQKLIAMFSPKRCEPKPIQSFEAVQAMLKTPEVNMSKALISKVMTALQCAKKRHVKHNHILTVIDYARPSNEKRLWVFDLSKNKMLYHTYVSHGLTSGQRLSQQFSNKHNSKASSIGVYKTDQSYYGRHGLSLRLDGLEAGFNDYARGRAVVMHSAWYVNEPFIQKYGRPGRSWGCPAISKEMKKPVINTIKNNSLLVIYYPGEKWLSHSKFLNCQRFSPIAQVTPLDATLKKSDTKRTDVLFIERKANHHYEENEPMLVMPADDYIKTFHKKAPLLRMLRCQIKAAEYIALSDKEFETLAQTHNTEALTHFAFVIPEVKNIRGYWKTEMKFVDFGHVKAITAEPTTKQYTVTFDKSAPKHLQTTHRFIRWLGL